MHDRGEACFLIFSNTFMIDILDEELFTEAVWDCFSVLDARYVGDQCKELLPRLQATFDATFETIFVVLVTKTGKPVSVHALLNSYEAAETMVRVLGEAEHEIGYLLRNK